MDDPSNLDDWDGLGGLPDRRYEKELPVSYLGGWWNTPLEHQRATNFTNTDLEALMSCAPGEEPEPIIDKDSNPYRGLGLDRFERAVLDAVVVSGLSYRQAARVLGVSPTTVHRVHKSAIERIRRQHEYE